MQELFYYCEDCKKDFGVKEVSKHIEHDVLEYTTDFETQARFLN